MRTSGGINKKLPINSDEESFVVAGVVLLCACGASRVPFWEALLPETPTRYARNAFFIPSRLQELVLDALEIKNPKHFVLRAFFSRQGDWNI